jgi:hypothetical protein
VIYRKNAQNSQGRNFLLLQTQSESAEKKGNGEEEDGQQIIEKN